MVRTALRGGPAKTRNDFGQLAVPNKVGAELFQSVLPARILHSTLTKFFRALTVLLPLDFHLATPFS